MARLSTNLLLRFVVPALGDRLAGQVDHRIRRLQTLGGRLAFHGIPNMQLHSGRQVRAGVAAEDPQFVISIGERLHQPASDESRKRR